MSLVESVKDTFRAMLATTASKIAHERTRRLAAIRAGEEETNTLLRAPEDRDRIAAHIRELVEGLRKQWVDQHGLATAVALSRKVARDMGPESDHLVEPSFPEWLRGWLTLETLSILAPDLVVGWLTTLVATIEFAPGPPAEARLARLQEITAERARLEHELAEISDAVMSHPIAAPLPPDHAAERERRARRHAEWAQNVRENAESYKRHPEMRPPEPPRP